MITKTDYIVLAIFIFSIWQGWARGLLRTIIGPGSLVAATLVSFFYYGKTKDIVMSLLIGLIGPFLLQFIFSFVMKFASKVTPEEKSVSTVSRTLGAAFNLLWNSIFVLIFLSLILLIPATIWKNNPIQKDITDSFTHSLIKQHLPMIAEKTDHVQNTFIALQDPARQEKLESNPEFQEIKNNAKVKEILADQTLIEQIQNREISKVLSNPKIQELLKDKTLVQNMLSLEKNLLTEKSGKDSGGKGPKVYEIK